MAPLFSWTFFFAAMYSQSVNMLDEVKAQITAENVTKGMLQHVWQEVGCMQGYRWPSLYSILHLTDFPCVYIKTVSVDETANNTFI
jgi:hypothetical protein